MSGGCGPVLHLRFGECKYVILGIDMSVYMVVANSIHHAWMRRLS